MGVAVGVATGTVGVVVVVLVVAVAVPLATAIPSGSPEPSPHAARSAGRDATSASARRRRGGPPSPPRSDIGLVPVDYAFWAAAASNVARMDVTSIASMSASDAPWSRSHGTSTSGTSVQQ